MHVERKCITPLAKTAIKDDGGENKCRGRRKRVRRCGRDGDGYRELHGVVVTRRDVLPADPFAKGRKQL